MDEFLPIKSFRVKNFKGIRDSGEVRFTPLTVFIGNNGSGKSSLIEALQTYQDIVNRGLDNAMSYWRGFEHIHNPPINFMEKNGIKSKNETIEFIVNGQLDKNNYFYANMTTEMMSGKDEIFISKEEIKINDTTFLNRLGDKLLVSQVMIDALIGFNHSILNTRIGWGLMSYMYATNPDYIDAGRVFRQIGQTIAQWQFTNLNPIFMTNEKYLNRSRESSIYLLSDGSNIAEYLLDIRKQSPEAFEGIIEALTYVLPYLADLQPYITSELERTVYLRMHEDTYTIPQWLLSTGTMRILCLLALFRHPTPPPVIFIEEIENGLDPRTIHFVVEEIRNLIVLGKSQVVITTHSPYLLDLLDLSQIVVVERENGETTFSRPADNEELEIWAREFSPGELYRMNKFARQEE